MKSETQKMTVTWSLIELGGVAGTYINGEKVQSNIPHKLQCGTMIGIGCPENSSTREKGKGKETFVFRLNRNDLDKNGKK